jgi:hypothetical protein
VAMHIAIQSHMIVHKVTLHTLAGQVRPCSQFWWHGGHFRSKKSCSLTHVLNISPQAGPVGGSSFFCTKYFHTIQAMNKTFTAIIK